MYQFQVNDRVKFTQEYLEANAECIDPGITDKELQGTIIDIVGGRLTIRFDDGSTDTYNPEAFEYLY